MYKNLTKLIIIAIFLGCNISYGQHYVITNVNIIDIENGQISYDHHLEIDEGHIKSIYKEVQNFGVEVIDGKGKYVIPGLWDMHVHLSMIGDASMPLFLKYGITGVRDMGGDIDLIKRYKQNPEFPHIISAGAILEAPRFYQIMKLLMGEEITKTRVSYADPGQAGRLIDSLINSGSDFIKLRTVLNQENFEALSKASKEKGVQLSGHIDPNIDFTGAINSGISSIEHSEFFHVLDLDKQQQEEIANFVYKKNVYYTPTLIAEIKNRMVPKAEVVAFLRDSLNETYTYRKFISSKLLENWALQEEVSKLEETKDWDKLLPVFMNFGKTLANAGVPLLAGTDCGLFLVIPGKSLHEELALLVEYFGISNLSALQTATINAAKYLKRPNEGIIEPGAMANLVVLDENPLEDIQNVSTIAFVIKNGKLYSKADLENLSTEVMQNVENERADYENNLLEHYRHKLSELMKPQSNN